MQNKREKSEESQGLKSVSRRKEGLTASKSSERAGNNKDKENQLDLAIRMSLVAFAKVVSVIQW